MRKKIRALDQTKTNLVQADYIENILQYKSTQHYIEEQRLQDAIEKVFGMQRSKQGIGTLSEKSIHSILKYFIEPNDNYHEVALEGHFADIYTQDGVVEIQTQKFERLTDKLAYFLEIYPVTIVYPILVRKEISIFDDISQTVIQRKNSPKHMSVYDTFAELYRIKPFLKHPNLHICMVQMDAEEYRMMSVRKNTARGKSMKYDRIPIGIREITVLERIEDYMQFIPYELDTFTTKTFAKACHIPIDTARITVNILYEFGLIERIGKQGNMYIYGIADAK